MNGPSSRRGFLLGLGTVSAAGGTGLVLPALAQAPVGPTVLHADQALLDAEAEWLHAEAEYKALSRASSAARLAQREALGPYPEELFLQQWESRLIGLAYCGGKIRGVRTNFVWRDSGANEANQTWTEPGLRRVIAEAVPALGRGGQTPHRIRRWRGLIPLAKIYDERRDALDRRFRCSELSAKRQTAETAQRRACARLHRIPATTVEGLAVHTRRLASSDWYSTNSAWTTLLQSAAAITGVALREPEFDAAGWAEAWKVIGGRIEWRENDEQWAFIAPTQQGFTEEQRDEARRIAMERGRHDAIINRWLNSTR